MPVVELAMATPKRANARKSDVDMDAVICLDMSHQWRLVEERREETGLYATCPHRIKICMVCGSLKEEVTSWRGYVIARYYKPDPVYLENARKLAKEVNERRAAYRRLLIGRPPKNACDRCGLVHESADCPDMF